MASTLETLLFTYCIYFITGLEGNELCIIFKNSWLQVEVIESHSCFPGLVFNQEPSFPTSP